MLTAGDIQNVNNAVSFINETQGKLNDTVAELGTVLSPDTEIYSALSTILVCLEQDLNELYNRVCWLYDEDYVAY